jgi:hypothetical protein
MVKNIPEYRCSTDKHAICVNEVVRDPTILVRSRASIYGSGDHWQINGYVSR